MHHLSVSEVQVISVSGSVVKHRPDFLAAEEPLEIRLTHGQLDNRQINSISITMRTPGMDKYLALGFLYTEGIIKSADDIADIQNADENCDRRAQNIVNVFVKEHVTIDIGKMQRHFYTTSSCGVCGKASIEAIHTYTGTGISSEFKVPPSLLNSLPQRLRDAQKVFQSTGGLHASALFSLSGDLLLLQEDVGRHNALDKLIGQALMEEVNMKQAILLLSGRASFELIQKAAMAGISFVAAIGAPSSLAAQLASSSGITLVGFLNVQRFNIYCGTQRIAIENT